AFTSSRNAAARIDCYIFFLPTSCITSDQRPMGCEDPADITVLSTSPFLQRFSSFSSQVIVFLSALPFSFSLSYFFFHCSAVSSTFTHTVFLMVLALKAHLCPNIKVDLVSDSL
uniref:Uncharacterized protein n=1 Tax=Esox lucius TaxID=8010 RepID=A0A6Q2Z120_ESOLU